MNTPKSNATAAGEGLPTHDTATRMRRRGVIPTPAGGWANHEKEQRERATAAEIALQEKEARSEADRKDPGYYWDWFNDYVLSEWPHVHGVIERAEQLLVSLAPRTVELGEQCGIIPESGLHGDLSSMSRACSGPVTLTADAAPALVRYLRVSLLLAKYRAREEKLAPFYWEALGDDAAADWSIPATTRNFIDLFGEMLAASSRVAEEWQCSGLTIDDLIDQDQANEHLHPAITILPADGTSAKPYTGTPSVGATRIDVYTTEPVGSEKQGA